MSNLFEDWWVPHQIELVEDLSIKWELKKFKPVTGYWLPSNERRIFKKLEEGETLPEGAVLVSNGWDHEHCELCFETISENSDSQKDGYTNGYNWVCRNCYEKYIIPFRTQNH